MTLNLETKILLIIDQHSFKRLEFLDLDYSTKESNPISIETFKFNCKFNKKVYNHILHSENNHLNSITDLILNLGVGLEKENNKNLKFLTKLIQKSLERETYITKITNNLDFIKDQNSQILLELKKLKTKNIESSEPFEFSKELDKLTKTIKNLDLGPTEKPRNNTTPPIYKHWKAKK